MRIYKKWLIKGILGWNNQFNTGVFLLYCLLNKNSWHTIIYRIIKNIPPTTHFTKRCHIFYWSLFFKLSHSGGCKQSNAKHEHSIKKTSSTANLVKIKSRIKLANIVIKKQNARSQYCEWHKVLHIHVILLISYTIFQIKTCYIGRTVNILRKKKKSEFVKKCDPTISINFHWQYNCCS